MQVSRDAKDRYRRPTGPVDPDAMCPVQRHHQCHNKKSHSDNTERTNTDTAAPSRPSSPSTPRIPLASTGAPILVLVSRAFRVEVPFVRGEGLRLPSVWRPRVKQPQPPPPPPGRSLLKARRRSRRGPGRGRTRERHTRIRACCQHYVQGG